jgi:hypothetical protein
MIRKDLHVQTEQITLCASRFLQTDDSDQSATQIMSADVQVNQPETMTINCEYKRLNIKN